MLMVRNATNGLPGPNEPIDFDSGERNGGVIRASSLRALHRCAVAATALRQF
jgi:hypothetical protein